MAASPQSFPAIPRGIDFQIIAKHPFPGIMPDPAPELNGHEWSKRYFARVWNYPEVRAAKEIAESEKSTRQLRSDINQVRRIAHFRQQFRAYERVNPGKQAKLAPALVTIWKTILEVGLEGVDDASREQMKYAWPVMEALLASTAEPPIEGTNAVLIQSAPAAQLLAQAAANPGVHLSSRDLGANAHGSRD